MASSGPTVAPGGKMGETMSSNALVSQRAVVRRLLLVAVLVSAAPASYGQGQFHMRDLWDKPPAPGTVVAMASSDPTRFKLCPNDCEISVQVMSIDPPNKMCTGSVLDASGSPADLWVVVPLRRNPTITWKLTSTMVSGATVAFNSGAGVSIHGSTRTDFDPQTSTGATHSWKSVNSRLMAFAYDILLDVTPASGTPYTCTLLDPIVINRGN
jgi:hypothetical protein